MSTSLRRLSALEALDDTQTPRPGNRRLVGPWLPAPALDTAPSTDQWSLGFEPEFHSVAQGASRLMTRCRGDRLGCRDPVDVRQAGRRLVVGSAPAQRHDVEAEGVPEARIQGQSD